MQVSCSAGVDCEFPHIRPLLNDVKRVVREKDRHVRVSGLYVDVRLSRRHDRYNGWAHPDTYSIRWGQLRVHDNGWVQMSLGASCSDKDIIRLFAHELRHIGQFNRGKSLIGVLSTYPLNQQQSEDDAYDFEGRILDLM
jgi:hypothetical protein